MKRSLRGSKPGGGAQKPETNEERAAHIAQNMDPNTLNTIQDTINQYGGRSQSELLRELKNYKNAGHMDEGALDNVAQRLMPMLTPEQQRRLFDVMGQLKK